MVNYVYVQIGQTWALQDFDSTVFLIGKGKELFFLPGCSVQLKQGVILIHCLKKILEISCYSAVFSSIKTCHFVLLIDNS